MIVHEATHVHLAQKKVGSLRVLKKGGKGGGSGGVGEKRGVSSSREGRKEGEDVELRGGEHSSSFPS